METTKTILVGGGEHARVVLDGLLDSGENVIALFDPKYSGELMGVTQRGEYDSSFEPDAKAIIAIGDNTLRKRITASIKHRFSKAIHHSAIVSKSARVGQGSMILHGAVVQAQTSIGNHVILNTKSQVDHDCVIGDYVHLGPGSILCGTVKIEEGAFVGAGAVVIQGRKIGKWAIVGAGSVVIEDVPDYAVVVGNPAKVIRRSLP